MIIHFFGDIMPSGIYSGKQITLSSKIDQIITKSDCRVATLETAVGEYQDIDAVKQPNTEVSVWSFESDLDKLKKLRINVVTLANNHANDCGIERLLALKKKLNELGIATIGAGKNLEEASKPYVFELGGKTLAIIGVCQNNPDSLGTLQYASENSAGVYEYNEIFLKNQIRDLKCVYNYVAIVIHWGIEHMWLPELKDVDIAEKLIDAGADAIIGGHPHHIQPVLDYKTRPVYYSLGNFFFPDFYLDKNSNTFYPPSNDAKKLPTFDWMAPGRRHFSMKYFWKYYGRLGMIAELNFDSKISFTKHYSLLTANSLTSKRAPITNFILLSFIHLVGKGISIKINKCITVFTHLFEHRFLGLFIKKYQFFKYIKKNNYDSFCS